MAASQFSATWHESDEASFRTGKPKVLPAAKKARTANNAARSRIHSNISAPGVGPQSTGWIRGRLALQIICVFGATSNACSKPSRQLLRAWSASSRPQSRLRFTEMLLVSKCEREPLSTLNGMPSSSTSKSTTLAVTSPTAAPSLHLPDIVVLDGILGDGFIAISNELDQYCRGFTPQTDTNRMRESIAKARQRARRAERVSVSVAYSEYWHGYGKPKHVT
ncbi:hypothetical protein BDZ89DRAFT_1075168 [Hymenopellis radicata]|nr:hypothetical protein BDZ89DRAFT_1075168 [Hymenopellis radicata]